MSGGHPQASKDKNRNYWPLINRLTTLTAVLVIGYIVWAAVKAQQQSAQPPVAQVSVLASAGPQASTSRENVKESSAEPLQPAVAHGSQSTVLQNPKIDPKLNPKPDIEPDVNPDIDTASVSATSVGELPAEGSNAAERAKPKLAIGPAPNFYDTDVARFLFENKCNECHTLQRVERHSFADLTAVDSLIDKMIENGLEVNNKQKSFLGYYLKSTYLENISE